MLAEKFDLTTYSNYIVSSIKRTKILELKDIDKNSILLGFKANEDELNCSGNVFLNTNDF